MTEYRPIKMTMYEFENFLIKALGLPKTTTRCTISLRAGEPPMIHASFIGIPVEVIDDELRRHHIAFRGDTRMERWWVKSGHKLYRRAK